jgi:hypothetical protein
MNICQYISKKALFATFLAFFCFSSYAYAEPPKEPNLLVSSDIQKVIDGFVESIVNAEIKEKEKEIDARFPEPRSEEDKRRVKAAKDALAAAAAASKEIIRVQLTQACFEAKCQTDTVKKVAEAYVVKSEASRLLGDYMKMLDDFIDQAERQSADLAAALRKLNTGIAEGNAKVNAWWNFFGIGQDALLEAQVAQAQARRIGNNVKEINEVLVKINEEMNSLQDGVKNGTLSAKEAGDSIKYIESLMVDIQRLISEAITYMKKPQLAAVIAKNAPDMNLAKKISDAQKILDQVSEKIREADSRKADELKSEFLNALPVPVDITKPLAPQLKIPPQVHPIPKSGNTASEKPSVADPFVESPSQSNSKPPTFIPPTPKPTTYRLQWPILDRFGQPTGSYDVFEYPSTETRPTPYNGVYKGRISPQQRGVPIEALPQYR